MNTVAISNTKYGRELTLWSESTLLYSSDGRFDCCKFLPDDRDSANHYYYLYVLYIQGDLASYANSSIMYSCIAFNMNTFLIGSPMNSYSHIMLSGHPEWFSKVSFTPLEFQCPYLPNNPSNLPKPHPRQKRNGQFYQIQNHSELLTTHLNVAITFHRSSQ